MEDYLSEAERRARECLVWAFGTDAIGDMYMPELSAAWRERHPYLADIGRMNVASGKQYVVDKWHEHSGDRTHVGEIEWYVSKHGGNGASEEENQDNAE